MWRWKRWEIEGKRSSVTIFLWEFCYFFPLFGIFFSDFMSSLCDLFLFWDLPYSVLYIIPPQQLPRYWEKNGFSIDIPPDDSIAIGLVWNWFLFWFSLLFFLFFLALLSSHCSGLNTVIGLYPAFFFAPWTVLFEYVLDMMCTIVSHSALHLWFLVDISYSIFKVLWHYLSFLFVDVDCFADGQYQLNMYENLNFLYKSSHHM